ncbi:MAG: DEAD/DEAH box helicase [Myxococcales bacterium]|jgi:hypothetical protein|nr:DEAD/DEAH box helicase [Myxococcales bacterium]
MTSSDDRRSPPSPHPVDGASPDERSRLREHLTAAARGRFGAIPAESIVERLLAVGGDADFPVMEAALDALLRRAEFAARDGLAVAQRPARGALLGAYTTARVDGHSFKKRGKGKGDEGASAKRRPRRGERRPYVTHVYGLSPLRVSCDCPDYLRSSLGICKHLIVVLDGIYSAPAGKRASAEQRPLPEPRLDWSPELPLRGSLDRLAGLRVRGKPLDVASQDLGQRRRLLKRLWAAVTKDPEACAPAARGVLEEELERCERLVRGEKGAPKALVKLRSLRRALYDYQRAGVERFLRRGRLLLADDMGLGKTTQAIAACHALFRAGRVQRGVLVVPASLKGQWLREWQATTNVPAAVVEGPAADRRALYRRHEEGFLILGYEQLLRDFEHVQALAPEMVVLDEAQRIKNYATKTAIYVKALTPEYRLVLTGTPFENRLEELASLLDWVDDVALAPKWRLVPWYTAWEGDGGSGKSGARNLDVLRARLEPCLVRRVRREVITQLPPRSDTRLPVEMTPQQQAAHDDLDQPILRLVSAGKRRPLTQQEFLRLMSLLTRQRIIANGLGQLDFDELWPSYRVALPDNALLEGLFSPKLRELQALIAELCVRQERKVVVFSQWRRMLRLAEWSLRAVLGDAGLRAVFFTGAESSAQRSRSVVEFHDDPAARVMFLSDAGGVGLNLQKAANACINLELPWNPAVLEQRIGRIYRLGQRDPIDVFNLVSEQSIEARIAGIVSSKRALFEGLFDGDSAEVSFDAHASFLQRVEELVSVERLPQAPSASISPEALDDVEARLDGGAEPEVSDEIDGGEAGRGGSESEPAATATGQDVPPSAVRSTEGNIAGLLRSLRVQRTSTGGLSIEAPPEAAGTLAALFEGMAQLLKAQDASAGQAGSGSTERG